MGDTDYCDRDLLAGGMDEVNAAWRAMKAKEKADKQEGMPPKKPTKECVSKKDPTIYTLGTLMSGKNATFDDEERAWQPVKIDRRGQRRFHGAFTGGFNAGYFNTVGSEKGWTPSTYVSSRTNRAKKTTANPVDFMDSDEKWGADMLVTQAGFNEEGSRESRMRQKNLNEALGKLGEEMNFESDSIGQKLLKKCGWRPGQGIGPRRIKPKEQREHILEDLIGVAPRDVALHQSQGKSNDWGLGYDPRKDPHQAEAMERKRRDKIRQQREGVLQLPKIVKGHGIGVLDSSGDEDEAYESGNSRITNRDLYDTSIGFGADGRQAEPAPKKLAKDRKSRWGGKKEDSTKARVNAYIKSLTGQDAYDGFTDVADTLKNMDNFERQANREPFAPSFPPIKVPTDFRPGHRFKKMDEIEVTADLRRAMKGLDLKITKGLLSRDGRISALVRGRLTAVHGQILPNAPAPKAMLSQAQQKQLDKAAGKFESVEVLAFNDAGGGLTIPIAKKERGAKEILDDSAGQFEDDPDKQMRYRTFVAAKMGVDLPSGAAAASGMTDFQKRTEQQDFIRAWEKIQPEIEDLEKKAGTRKALEKAAGKIEDVRDPANAAKMGKYGRLTRREEMWIPERLLCKRFHVKVPKIVDYAAGAADIAPKGSSVFDVPSAGSKKQIAAKLAIEASMKKKLGIKDLDMGEESSKVEQVAKLLASEETYDPLKEAAGTVNAATKEPERPAPSLFTAIFEDKDSEDEDSDDEDEGIKPGAGANPNSDASTRVRFIPRATREAKAMGPEQPKEAPAPAPEAPAAPPKAGEATDPPGKPGDPAAPPDQKPPEPPAPPGDGAAKPPVGAGEEAKQPPPAGEGEEAKQPPPEPTFAAPAPKKKPAEPAPMKKPAEPAPARMIPLESRRPDHPKPNWKASADALTFEMDEDEPSSGGVLGPLTPSGQALGDKVFGVGQDAPTADATLPEPPTGGGFKKRRKKKGSKGRAKRRMKKRTASTAELSDPEEGG